MPSPTFLSPEEFISLLFQPIGSPFRIDSPTDEEFVVTSSVDLSGQRIPHNHIFKKLKVKGDLILTGARIEEWVFLDDCAIKGSFTAPNLTVARSLILSGLKVSEDVDLRYVHVSYILDIEGLKYRQLLLNGIRADRLCCDAISQPTTFTRL